MKWHTDKSFCLTDETFDETGKLQYGVFFWVPLQPHHSLLLDQRKPRNEQTSAYATGLYFARPYRARSASRSSWTHQIDWTADVTVHQQHKAVHQVTAKQINRRKLHFRHLFKSECRNSVGARRGAGRAPNFTFLIWHSRSIAFPLNTTLLWKHPSKAKPAPIQWFFHTVHPHDFFSTFSQMFNTHSHICSAQDTGSCISSIPLALKSTASRIKTKLNTYVYHYCLYVDHRCLQSLFHSAKTSRLVRFGGQLQANIQKRRLAQWSPANSHNRRVAVGALNG